ncbi:MAG TPA: sigma-70 family RNA polymerase sigma factor [Gaiellaceae bacterium]
MEASRARAAGRPRQTASPRRLSLVKRPTDRAFERLYRRHAREVYQYALALVANPADAEDVTQTTFLNAYRAFQKGERPHKPHNWLITIAHNVCRMRWRQAGSRPKEVALDEAPEPVAPDHEQPELDEVLAALAQLSFNQRSALVMRELEGRSYNEIAGVLGVSVSAVEALLFRARRGMRLHRGSLGVLTTVPLPGSLAAFFGGGGAVAVGGSALGADLILKAAAVVAAGAVTAGAGYKGVEVVARSDAATPKAAAIATPRRHTQAPAARVSRHAVKPKAHAKAQGHRAARAATLRIRKTRPAPSAAQPASSPTQAPTQSAPAPAPAPPATTPVTVPPPPAPPAVTLPQLPAVPPVTVPVPTLPPLPVKLPPLPVVPPLPPLPPLLPPHHP